MALGAATCNAVLGSIHDLDTSSDTREAILSHKNYITSVYSLVIIVAVGVVTGYLAQLGHLPNLLGIKPFFS